MRTLSIMLLLCLSIPVLGQNCSANAGPNAEYCKYDGSFMLDGTPPSQNAGNPLNSLWTQLSGPATISFTGTLEDPLVSTTNGTGVLDPGTYFFQYCVDCSDGAQACNTVTIEIGDDPSPASINPHPAEVCETITLTGSALAPGETADWFFKPSDGMLIETPGGNPTQTTFTLVDNNTAQCREYTICYVINNNGCRSVDSTTVHFHSTEDWNLATSHGTSICRDNFNLYGNLPNCPGWTYNWTIVSQTGGTATLSSPTSENTAVSVSGPGTYTFQLMIGGTLACPDNSRTITINVLDTVGIDIGNNQYLYYCDVFPSSILLEVPFLPGVTYTWENEPGLDPSTPSGPNQATFTPPTSTGDYTISVEATSPNGGCDDIVYFVIRTLPSISADADSIFLGCGGAACYDLTQHITLSNTGFTPSAVVVNAPPNSLNIGATYSTSCINLDVVGIYEFDVFVYIGSSNDPNMPDCGDTVRVVATVYPGIDATNAGSDIFLCGDTSITSLNGFPPTILGTTVTWAQIDNLPPVTFIPSNTVPNPQISGLQTSMGAPYMFQYSFGLGQGCEAIDTVLVYVDSCDCITGTCPCEEDFTLASCCENQLDSTHVGGGGQIAQGLAAATASPNIEEVSKYLNGKSASSFTWESGNACDPCIDGEYPLWVELDGEIIGDPFDPNDSCYVITWSDGNITVQDWAIVAYPGTTYTVQVWDSCTNCVWVDSFAYFCCEDIDIEITQCCFPEPAAASASKGSVQTQTLSPTEQAAQDALNDYIAKNGSGAVPANYQNGCADPCDNPGLPFPIWVVNNNTSPPTPLDAPYQFQWYNDDPTNYPISFPNSPLIFGYVGVTYWVEVIDSAGCVHTDTFRVDCCDPQIPTHLSCVSINGATHLTWSPVPGATQYAVYAVRNDPDCCSKGGGWPQSLLPIYTPTNSLPVSQINVSCYSWRVRSICPDGTMSGFSQKVCYPMPCLSVADPGGEKREGVQTDDYTWNIFPSPASSKLHIRGEGLHTGMKVMLTDLLGRTVFQTISAEEGSLDLNVSGMANGVYQLQIYHLDGSLSHSHKVLIQQ